MVSGILGLYPLDARGTSPSQSDNYKHLQTFQVSPGGKIAPNGEPLFLGLPPAPACTLQEDPGG